MIDFTDAARQKVREYMDMAEGSSLGVRVVAHRQGRSSAGERRGDARRAEEYE
mgnify:CR=1 FL=1